MSVANLVANVENLIVSNLADATTLLVQPRALAFMVQHNSNKCEAGLRTPDA